MPDAIFSNIEQSQNPFDSHDNAEHNGYLVRSRRDAYIVPSDYYANYYNDYYNNYYNRPSNGYVNSERPSRPSADRFDDGDRPSGGYVNSVRPSRPSADRFDGDDDDSSNNIITSQGTKYVYTPIFKYKSTQQKRHKLFVPNLFG